MTHCFGARGDFIITWKQKFHKLQQAFRISFKKPRIIAEHKIRCFNGIIVRFMYSFFLYTPSVKCIWYTIQNVYNVDIGVHPLKLYQVHHLEMHVLSLKEEWCFSEDVTYNVILILLRWFIQQAVEMLIVLHVYWSEIRR